MQDAGTEREARLKREYADQYPTLPVQMWTSAASLADLVASNDPLRTGRALLEADFEFRGGKRRSAGWVARTRTGEPA
jgi:hypothetical protein